MIVCKSRKEMEVMDRANRLVHAVLLRLADMAKPGVSTAELDKVAESMAAEAGAVPAFKGYRGFPASACISINQEVVHGIPSEERILQEGDIVSIDFGVHLEGFYGDSAITVGVGEISDEANRLMQVTKEALDKGVAEMKPGAHLSNVSAAVQDHVESQGFSVVREFVGHGIGSKLHEDPPVPNYGKPGTGPRLRPGMVLAIEPMVTTGSWRVRTGTDNWTVTTEDGGLAAHFEYSVAVTEEGPWVLGVNGHAGSRNEEPESSEE